MLKFRRALSRRLNGKIEGGDHDVVPDRRPCQSFWTSSRWTPRHWAKHRLDALRLMWHACLREQGDDNRDAEGEPPDACVALTRSTCILQHGNAKGFLSCAGGGPNCHRRRNPAVSRADFEFGKVLGTGSFGRVCLAVHKEKGFVCAIKALSKAHIIKNQQARPQLGFARQPRHCCRLSLCQSRHSADSK